MTNRELLIAFAKYAYYEKDFDLSDATVDAFLKTQPEQKDGLSGGFWQVCPKCNAQGSVSKPPYIPGDIYEWTTSQSSFECNVCHGQKIISTINGLSPLVTNTPTPSVEKSEGEEAGKMSKEFTDWYNDSQDAFMESRFNMAEIAYAAWQKGRARK